MPDFEFACLPTMIGSLPHTDAGAACDLVKRLLRDIPTWPQLPRRAFRENMYAQYSQGFPGIAISAGKVYVDRTKDIQEPLETLYRAYLDNDASKLGITRQYATGLHACLDARKDFMPRGVKGQITGPVTWGLTVTDSTGRPILYDEVLGDAVPRFLRLKATWQEDKLRKISRKTIMFVDEPYLAAYGSVSTGSLSKEKVVGMLNEVFSGMVGVKGIHCCGNTDWSVLLATDTDIISYDAYNYGQSLSLYPAEVKKFLAQGKAIAWGIVPNDTETLAKETVPSLRERLEETIAPFTRGGIPFRQLVRQSLLTPSCGLASLSEEGAAQALELLVSLSAEMRRKYV